MKTALLALALSISLAACAKKDDKKVTTSGGITENACTRSTVSENIVGTCQIRLLTPTVCQELDLTGDKTAEVRWTTDGTDCPSDQQGRFTGFIGYIGGNPITQNEDNTLNNVTGFQLAGEGVNRGGGAVLLRARDLEGLTSTDGTFEIAIRSGLQAGPASITIKIKR